MRKVAIDRETWERHLVVDTLNDFESDLSPTSFFAYFKDVPIHNAITECLNTLDITESLEDGLPEKEEIKREENIPCLPMDEGATLEGIQRDSEEFEEEG